MSDEQQDWNGRVVLLGICTDENSSYMRGAAEAPPRIRAALHSGASNLTSETGVDLSQDAFVDAGDRYIGSGAHEFMRIEQHVADVLDAGGRPLVLGGDHAVTYPVVKAMAAHYGRLNILHFDAHPDLYDVLDGNRLSHACPFARIMEAGLAERLVQVGICTLNVHQQEQAERFGVEITAAREFDAATFAPALVGPVYLSFDMDVLDPAYAPGVSHLEPGGLSVREVLAVIHRLRQPIVGADIVEYNPRQDLPNGMTAVVAAKLVKEIGAMMVEGLHTKELRVAKSKQNYNLSKYPEL